MSRRTTQQRHTAIYQVRGGGDYRSLRRRLLLPNLFHGSLDHSPELLVFLASLDIRHLMKLGFLDQFHVTLVSLLTQLFALNRHQYCTTDFHGVSAVVEPAILGELVNIREAVIDAGTDGNHSQFPHARRINDKRSIFESYQLSTSCRMSSSAVLFAYRVCLKELTADEMIEEGSLAHAR